MRKVLYIVNLAEILVGLLGVSVQKVDLDGVVKKRGDFRFWIVKKANVRSKFPPKDMLPVVSFSYLPPSPHTLEVQVWV